MKLAVIMTLLATSSFAQTLPKIPPLAEKYLPLLKEESQTYWPSLKPVDVLAGQVEQETCISLKSKGCWNNRTTLKTKREFGAGLAMTTIKYGPRGFDNFAVARKDFKALTGYAGEGIYDPRLQLRYLVLYDRRNYNSIKYAKTDYDRLAFMLVYYNRGAGGALMDRKICQAKPDCDPGVWFGNVELTTNIAKSPVQGYKKSFADIRREYPYNILKIRRFKYQPYLSTKEQ